MIRDIIITKKTEDRMTLIVSYTIIIVLSTVLLRYLWNESLVKHITVLKPIKTMLDALLLSIGLMVIRGC
tara:strand:- start:378 stop:587 length:210 start_codon:yes stop_codon:yes gene_type:complete